MGTAYTWTVGSCGGVVDPERIDVSIDRVREQVMRSGPVRDRVQVLRAVDVCVRAELREPRNCDDTRTSTCGLMLNDCRITALALK